MSALPGASQTPPCPSLPRVRLLRPDGCRTSRTSKFALPFGNRKARDTRQPSPLSVSDKWSDSLKANAWDIRPPLGRAQSLLAVGFRGHRHFCRRQPVKTKPPRRGAERSGSGSVRGIVSAYNGASVAHKRKSARRSVDTRRSEHESCAPCGAVMTSDHLHSQFHTLPVGAPVHIERHRHVLRRTRCSCTPTCCEASSACGDAL